jgi:hypothetical protein
LGLLNALIRLDDFTAPDCNCAPLATFAWPPG